MKLIYDERFRGSSYAQDNAAMPGRMEAALSGLGGTAWERVAPPAATLEQLHLAHDPAYVQTVVEDPERFAMASLAAGGAILAGRLAHGGDPAFACIRPPGHHASRMGAWGHCTFSNLALALLVLRAERRIERAFVLDFDAHTGDGTREVLAGWPQAVIFNPFAATAEEYLAVLEGGYYLKDLGAKVLALCQGFAG